MEDIRDPEELCRPSLASREAVELILLDRFIPAAYRKPGRWTGEQAQPWLSFLASHLQNTIRTEDFAWWQLREAKASGVSTGVLAGLAAGVAVGLLGAIVGALLGSLAFWVQGGLLLGIGGLAIGVPVGHEIAAYFKANHAMLPSRGLDVRWKRLVIWLIAFSVLWTLAGRVLMHARLIEALALGFGLSLSSGVQASTLAPIPNMLSGAASPGNILARDRRAAIVRGVTIGLTSGIWILAFFYAIFGRLAWNMSSSIAALRHGTSYWTVSWHWTGNFLLPWSSGNTPTVGHLNGLITGLALGFWVGCGSFILPGQKGTAWGAFVVARSNLALRHALPYPLMDFLADAHNRGVLRQVGSRYRFGISRYSAT